MRALITGASGFVGSCLARLMVEAGETVAIIHRPESDLWRVGDVLGRLRCIQGDLLTLNDAAGAIRDFAPDTVFHLAWYGVGNKHRNEEGQIDKNIISSLELLRIGRAAGCKTFVGLGSQAEYGPHGAMIDETAATNPTTLYGAAKLSAYLLCKAIAEASGIRFAWLRIFSAYGPKDNPDWMIPYMIRTLLKRQRPSLTAGEQKWDYVFVEDAARAIYEVARHENASGAFNLGSGQVSMIRSIQERVRDLIDPSLPLGLGEVPYRPDQVMHLQADITRLRQLAGWEPKVPLDEGLRRCVEWYRTSPDAQKA